MTVLDQSAFDADFAQIMNGRPLPETLEEADKALDRLVEERPADPLVLRVGARFLGLQLGDKRGAEQLYERLERIAPADARGLSEHAVFILESEGDAVRAEELHARALTLAPDDPVVIGRYAGFLVAARGNVESAMPMYEQAVLMAPEDPALLRAAAGFLYCHVGDEVGAMRYSTDALSLDPHPEPYLWAAMLAARGGAPDRAQAAFEEAVKAAPMDQIALIEYATFLESQGRADPLTSELYERAVDAATSQSPGSPIAGFSEHRAHRESLAARETKAATLCRCASYFHRRELDPPRALSLYEQALAAVPGHLRATVGRARLLADSYGDPALGLAAVKEHPLFEVSTPLLLCGSYILGRHLNDVPGAETLLEHARALGPNDSWTLESAAYHYHFSAGHLDTAESFYREALAQQQVPDPVLSANLVQVLLATGKAEEGSALLNELLKEPLPSAVRLELLFYVVAHGLDGWDAALRRLRRLLELGFRSRRSQFRTTVAWVVDRHPFEAPLTRELADAIADTPRFC